MTFMYPHSCRIEAAVESLRGTTWVMSYLDNTSVADMAFTWMPSNDKDIHQGVLMQRPSFVTLEPCIFEFTWNDVS